MRLCRFGQDRLGLVTNENTVRDVTAALDVLPSWRYPLPPFDPLIAYLDQVTARVQEIAAQCPDQLLANATLLSPIANPGKIIAAPVNYQKHLEEVRTDAQLHHGNQAHMAPIHTMGLFLKASSSLVGPSQGIHVRMPDRRTDHEVELAVIIGKQAHMVRAEDALSYVAGYCIGLDITIRGPEDRSFRKSPDSYTVLGPWMVTADELRDPSALDLSLTLNGETKQSSNTRNLILGVPQLIQWASSFYTLRPGDVILTGTPEGVSPIVPGDQVIATIAGIGSMHVPVSSLP
jgi:2,4-didehydro-3-deoxy-L-rhamnonate hydrolase